MNLTELRMCKIDFCQVSPLKWPFFFQYDVLEVDQFTHTLVPFPLLASPSDYFPDTQDLTVDTEAREYWLQCFEDALDKVRVVVLIILLAVFTWSSLLFVCWVSINRSYQLFKSRRITTDFILELFVFAHLANGDQELTSPPHLPPERKQVHFLHWFASTLVLVVRVKMWSNFLPTSTTEEQIRTWAFTWNVDFHTEILLSNHYSTILPQLNSVFYFIRSLNEQ